MCKHYLHKLHGQAIVISTPCSLSAGLLGYAGPATPHTSGKRRGLQMKGRREGMGEEKRKGICRRERIRKRRAREENGERGEAM